MRTVWFLAALSSALIFAPAARAAPARQAILEEAQRIYQEEGFQGGGASVSMCHRGKARGTVVCSATFEGRLLSPEGPAEAVCTAAIAAVWRRIEVEGYVTRGAGFWSPRLASPVGCEGSVI